MTDKQLFQEEIRQRRLWTRGASNAIGILHSLITDDCPMVRRLELIDLMCHIDGVVWI